MELELRHLKLVVALAEHGTLTRAGDVLHLSQSALSHQLRDLEDRVGKPLFTRARRQMHPTAAGDTLVQAARAVLATLDDTACALRSEQLASPIPLRLATECNTCYSWLPAVLPAFRDRFPRVEIRLELPAGNRLLSSLVDGQLDLAIMSSPVRDRRVAAIPLFDDELLVAVPPDHRFTHRPHVSIPELRNETLILYSSVEHSTVIRRVMLANGVFPKATIAHVQLTEAIVELVKAGVGIAILAKWSLTPHLDSGTVRGIRITAKGFHRKWQAVVPKRLAGADYITGLCGLLATHVPAGATPRLAPPAIAALGGAGASCSAGSPVPARSGRARSRSAVSQSGARRVRA
jgi:LysR family transcriptional regulator for metE and metH